MKLVVSLQKSYDKVHDIMQCFLYEDPRQTVLFVQVLREVSGFIATVLFI